MASEENKNPVTRTGQTDLDQILKNKEQLYTGHDVSVFKAIYNLKGIDQTVAAKVLTVDNFQQMRAKLEEVRFVDKLSHIPRIVIIHDVIPQESHTGAGFDIVLIQEFADAGSLEKEIRKRGLQNPQRFWSEGALMSFIYSCVETLAQLQQMGIAHWDIKPQNVLLFSNRDFKICDLGVSKQVDNTTMALSDFSGTPAYLAYELKNAMQERSSGIQTEGLVRVFKCDMVSLGLMVFNMARLCMTGQFNNHIDAMEKQEEEYQKMTYSETFKNILRRMLTLDPTKRPDFIQLLEELKEMNIESVLLNSDWPGVAPAPSQRPIEPADEDEGPTQVVDYMTRSSFGQSHSDKTVNSYAGYVPSPACDTAPQNPVREAPQPPVRDIAPQNPVGNTTAVSENPQHNIRTLKSMDTLEELPSYVPSVQQKVYLTLAKDEQQIHTNPDGWMLCQNPGTNSNTVEDRRHYMFTEVGGGFYEIYQDNGLNVYTNNYEYVSVARKGESTNTDESRRRFRMEEVAENVYEFILSNGHYLCQASWYWLATDKNAGPNYRRWRISEVQTDFEWFEIVTVARNETLYTNHYQWVGVATNSTSTNTDDNRRKFRIIRNFDNTVEFALPAGQTMYAENSKEVGTAYSGNHNNEPDRRRFRMTEVESGIFEFVLKDGQTMYTTPKGWISVAQVGKKTNTEESRRRYTFRRV